MSMKWFTHAVVPPTAEPSGPTYLLQVLALLRIPTWLISTSDTDGSDHGKTPQTRARQASHTYDANGNKVARATPRAPRRSFTTVRRPHLGHERRRPGGRLRRQRR